MKISKEARKLSRSLFRASFVNGRLDQAKVSAVVAQAIAEKPRQYLSAIKNLQRLIRLELDKRHAVIESAAPLDDTAARNILSNLQAKYGADVTSEFKVNPELIGGLRVKLGSDVWDGSVRSRLNQLQEIL